MVDSLRTKVQSHLNLVGYFSLKNKEPSILRLKALFLSYVVFYYYAAINGAITSATTDINFNKMFSDGPEVSLNGSPTVSPTTVAL